MSQEGGAGQWVAGRDGALGAEGSPISMELLALSAAASQGCSLWGHTLVAHTGTL